jgi:hypothetical protein
MFKGNKLDILHEFNTIDDIDFALQKNNCKDVEEFKKIINNYFYFITVVPKKNVKVISNIAEMISAILSVDKKNIFLLINEKIDNFVKSQNFYDLEIKHFFNDNPIFNKLREVKILSENFLCCKCQIKKYNLDYRGNTVNPNSSNNLIRGTEKYDPPYGWIGIGLNVLGKYDNGNNDWLTNNTNSSEWAIAYRGISPNYLSNINELLKNIITTNCLNNGISGIKAKSNDKRNWGKVGKGIYLTPKIRIAEEFTTEISFNNKRYKVLLMARVYIKKIREPENSYFWVLNDEDIRIYRILFKEIS